MILVDEVFASLKQGQGLTRDWQVPVDLPYFRGHFPGQPIFPAVGIVDASLCVLASVLGVERVHVPVIASAKFTHPMGPGDKVQVTVLQESENLWTVDWSGAGQVYAFLKIRVDA